MTSKAPAKQKIVDSVKESNNILVTVSNSPSVDELSAALGLTLFLNKLDKHTTAIASGEMPNAIAFLDPEKTFEDSIDGLRDFIVALDKEKADHLRYKVEGDMVKIFITPYRTAISKDDLEFSQGDYNVELVLALNTSKEEDLDAALLAHGKILHDATVATITAGEVKSNFGSINWSDRAVSGVSEMVADLVDSLKTTKANLDDQVATALMTGIVATTDRFSNDLTSPQTMKVASQLMSAGANQQLIASELQEPDETESDDKPSDKIDITTDTMKIDKSEPSKKTDSAEKEADDSLGSLKIDHSKRETLDEKAETVAREAQDEATKVAEEQLSRQLSEQAGAPVADIQQDLERATQEKIVGHPSVGGTLNATTARAAEDKQRELEREQNKTILTHGTPIGSEPQGFIGSPLNASMAGSDEPPKVDIFANPVGVPRPDDQPLPPSNEPVVEPAPIVAEASATESPVLEGMPAQPPVGTVDDSQQSAMADVTAALENQPPAEPIVMPTEPPTAPEMSAQPQSVGSDQAPAPTPAPMEMPPLPPMPDFSSLPPLPPAPAGSELANLPPLQPSEQQPPQPVGAVSATPAESEFNPSQFQIPNQP